MSIWLIILCLKLWLCATSLCLCLSLSVSVSLSLHPHPLFPPLHHPLILLSLFLSLCPPHPSPLSLSLLSLSLLSLSLSLCLKTITSQYCAINGQNACTDRVLSVPQLNYRSWKSCLHLCGLSPASPPRTSAVSSVEDCSATSAAAHDAARICLFSSPMWEGQ